MNTLLWWAGTELTLQVDAGAPAPELFGPLRG
jgi:hypothetical protein